MSAPDAGPGARPEPRSLLDLVTGVGAATDAAQVVSDLAARRIVHHVARDPAAGALDADALRALAAESDRIARRLSHLTTQYEQLRKEHFDSLAALDEAPTAEVVETLEAVETAGRQTEEAATALHLAIDSAERRAASRPTLRAVPTRGGGSVDRRPPAGPAGPSGTLLH